MTDQWRTWNVCGSNIAGVPSNQQPIESEHHQIKVFKLDMIRAPLPYLLHRGFPDLLSRASAMRQVDVPITNDCNPANIPRAVLSAGKLYLEEPQAPREKMLNYKVGLKGSVDLETGIPLKQMMVNSSHHTIQRKGKAGEVTSARINVYQNSLVAKEDFEFPVVPAGKSKVSAAIDACTSLYIVQREVRTCSAPRNEGKLQ